MEDSDLILVMGGALLLFGGAWWAIRRAGRELRELTGRRDDDRPGAREAAFLLAMQAAAKAKQAEREGAPPADLS